MAKEPKQPRDLPHPDDIPIEDVVEFVEEIPDPEGGPVGFDFQDDPASKPAQPPKEDEGVLDENVIHALEVDAALSGVFSSAVRIEADSAVLPKSEVIRAEPLSDSVAIDPIPDIVMNAESDVQKAETKVQSIYEMDVDAEAIIEDELVEVVSDVVPAEVVDDALVIEDDDAVVDVEELLADSGVSPRSGPQLSPEKEPVLDLDETDGLDSPAPKKRSDPTIALGGSTSDDIDINELMADALLADEAVDLGEQPARAGESGIDPLAEELESGVRLDAAKPKRPATPSVEFDELVVEEEVADFGADDLSKPAAKSAKLPAPSGAPLLIDDDVSDVDEAAQKANLAGSDDDLDINAILDEEATELSASSDSKRPVVADEDFVDDAEPVTTPKREKDKKTAAVAAEPKRRGGWGSLIGGIVLGGLLTAGAGVGYLYMEPEFLTGPKALPPITKLDVKPIAKTPVQLARESMDVGKYGEALEQLADETDKAALAVRGEARWLGYYQKQSAAKAALNPDDSEVKQALDDLAKSENRIKLEHVQTALQAGEWKAEVDQAKKNADLLNQELLKVVKEKDDAAKESLEAKAALADINKALKDANTDVKGIEALAATKKDLEAKLLDASKALAEANKALLAANGKEVGEKGLQEALASRDKAVKEKEEAEKKLAAIAKEVTETKESLADIAKALKDASIDDGGAKGIEALVQAKKEVESKLAEANKALVAAIGKDAGGKALAEALASRDKLAGDVKDLAQMIAAAYKELADAKFVPAGGDPRKDLVAAAKAARTRAETPIPVAPPVNVVAGPTLEQQLDRLVAAMAHGGEKSPDLIADANRVAKTVLSDAKSSPAAKTKALTVQGLAMRNQIDDATRTMIRTEAENAAKDPMTAASGNFVLGRLEEQAGNWPKAEEFFRQALKSSPDDEQADQIRVRLGRLLLRGGGGPGPFPAEPKKEEKSPKEPADEAPKVSFLHPLAALALTQAAEEKLSPEALARIQESIDLAQSLMKSKDRSIRAQGHFLYGEALGRQGQRNQGLREFVRGFELLYPDVPLGKMLDDGATLTVSEADIFQRANPLLAEKHYGMGLHLYHEKKLAEAEEHFQQAITHFDKDARYYYFLGLAQYDLGRRANAAASWEQASRLEANGRPNTREINTSLERVQGDLRNHLNASRDKAIAR
jgi:hypothetical protein